MNQLLIEVYSRFVFVVTLGRSNGLQILKDGWISDLSKVVIEYAIGLVFFGIIGIAFEAIDGPVDPINISLFKISNQIFPHPISFVISELSQNKRVAVSSDKGLRIEHF